MWQSFGLDWKRRDGRQAWGNPKEYACLFSLIFCRLLATLGPCSETYVYINTSNVSTCRVSRCNNQKMSNKLSNLRRCCVVHLASSIISGFCFHEEAGKVEGNGKTCVVKQHVTFQFTIWSHIEDRFTTHTSAWRCERWCNRHLRLIAQPVSWGLRYLEICPSLHQKTKKNKVHAAYMNKSNFAFMDVFYKWCADKLEARDVSVGGK